MDRHRYNFRQFYDTFEDLFYNHSIIINDQVLKQYSKEWKKPAVQRDLERYDSLVNETDRVGGFEPRGAQIEALYALKCSRREGAKKGLVYAATGIGKTYLAAFDSRTYENVLFVAHREEILKQAAACTPLCRIFFRTRTFGHDVCVLTLYKPLSFA